jgi:hypothetical protein
MTLEKWQELVGRLKDTFPIIREGSDDLEPVGTADFIEFQAPLGHLRLEFVRKPVKIGEHGVGSRRIGSNVQLEAEYSDEDTIQTLKAYKKEGPEGWVELNNIDALLK